MREGSHREVLFRFFGETFVDRLESAGCSEEMREAILKFNSFLYLTCHLAQVADFLHVCMSLWFDVDRMAERVSLINWRAWFEPTHRLLFNIKPEEFHGDAVKWFTEQGEGVFPRCLDTVCCTGWQATVV